MVLGTGGRQVWGCCDLARLLRLPHSTIQSMHLSILRIKPFGIIVTGLRNSKKIISFCLLYPLAVTRIKSQVTRFSAGVSQEIDKSARKGHSLSDGEGLKLTAGNTLALFGYPVKKSFRRIKDSVVFEQVL